MSPLLLAGAIAGLAVSVFTLAGVGIAVVRYLSRIEFSAAQAADSVTKLATTVADIADRQREHGEELAVVKALLGRERRHEVER
jgi:hypothetical protein